MLLAVACENPFGSDCVFIGVFGFYITVADAETKAAPCAVPVVTVTDGAYVEEQAAPPFPGSGSPSYALADERPGTYRVQVTATGYRDVVLDDMKITRGGHCDYLHHAKFTVALTKLP